MTTLWGIHNDAIPASELVAGGFVSIGWERIGDLREVGDDQAGLRDLLRSAYPEAKEGALPVWAGVLRRFAFEIAEGDVIIAPDREARLINIGIVAGPYRHEAVELHPHRRDVRWLMTGVPRTSFSQPALNEIGSAVTLFEIRRHPQEFLEALAEAGHPVRVGDAAGRASDADTEDLVALGAEFLRAMIEGDSVFTPGRPVWTLESARELERSFVERPDESGRSFSEKLDDQLAGVSDDGLQLFAELWCLNLAPLADYAPQTKRQLLHGILAKMKVPVDLPDLVEAALHGQAFNGGVAFKTRRPFQLGLLVRFAVVVLSLSPAERKEALSAPKGFEALLESIHEPREPSQRYALKWLLYPGYYLDNVSEKHRLAIRNAFTAYLDGSAANLDEELFQIRQALSAGTGSSYVHFYRPPLLDRWDPDRTLTRLDLPAKVGKRAWLVRGNDVKGRDLVPTWLADGAVTLAATKLREVTPGISRDDLKAIVDEDYAHASYAARAEKLDEFHAFLSRMLPGHLVVAVEEGRLYLGEVEDAAVYRRSSSGEAILERSVAWGSTGFVIEDLGSDLKARLKVQRDVLDLTQQLDSLEALLESQTEPVQTPPVESAAVLKDATAELAESLNVDIGWLQECIDLLNDRPQLIFYGPPGTGKTFIAQKLAAHVAGDNVRLVQFHPSYSYEDFFEGYRPTQAGGFELRPGPMRRIVDQAFANPHEAHVLIIDEINRGNLAKVFGELYFLLEYREDNVELLYGDDDFSLPPNVFMIGTMNTADRSIALVDAAMRRRFAFVALHPSEPPTEGVLRTWLKRREKPERNADLLDELNRRIDDDDFKIGPSYFMREAVYADGGLGRTWRTSILPLLEEHHYGELTKKEIDERYGLDAIAARVDRAQDAAALDEVTDDASPNSH